MKQIMNKMVSAMTDEFNQAYKQSDSDWITFIGQPILYDHTLFVTRKEDKDEQIRPSLVSSQETV